MTSELLDDHQNAMKEEGTITDLRQKMEELNAAREAAAKKINQLQVDLDHEVTI